MWDKKTPKGISSEKDYLQARKPISFENIKYEHVYGNKIGRNDQSKFQY